MIIIFIITTAILATATILPIWRHESWRVRSFDFPRLQFSLIALMVLVAALLLLDIAAPATWVVLTVTTLCFLYQAWWIIPYTPFFPVEVKSAEQSDGKPTLKIITANVLRENRQADKLLELVHENEPDILVTLETNEWWQTQLEGLEKNFPHTVKCPLDNYYGMHVYSKFPLTDTEVSYLVQADVPSIHTLINLPSGHKIRAHFLHPPPPTPDGNELSLERDAELIIVAKSVADDDQPTIVTGDLNDVGWSRTARLFRKISGLLDPRVGRGMYNTFHADYWFMRWPLDHLFHSHHFTLREIDRLRHFGSDHFALFTELVYDDEVDPDHNGLEADETDMAEAIDIAARKGVSKTDVPQPGKQS